MRLEDSRGKIDETDTRIVRLVAERIRIAEEIGEKKKIPILRGSAKTYTSSPRDCRDYLLHRGLCNSLSENLAM